MITREQIGALVVLVQAIRPAWDSRAIRPVLERLAPEHDLAELAWAAIRTAEDPTKRTPAAIAWEGDHWRAMPSTGLTVTQRAERDEHLHLRAQEIAECRWCDHRGRLPGDVMCYHDEDPEIRADRAAARANIARALIRRTIDNQPA
jgi:hypothetical protein